MQITKTKKFRRKRLKRYLSHYFRLFKESVLQSSSGNRRKCKPWSATCSVFLAQFPLLAICLHWCNNLLQLHKDIQHQTRPSLPSSLFFILHHCNICDFILCGSVLLNTVCNALVYSGIILGGENVCFTIVPSYFQITNYRQFFLCMCCILTLHSNFVMQRDSC